MSITDCKELIFDDAIEIDIYASDSCAIPIPPHIAINEMGATSGMLPTPLFSARLDEQGDGVMQEAPTVKVTNDRQNAGNIYSHDLQIPIYIGRKEVEKKVDALQGVDFHIGIVHADGSQEFIYSLPNTSTCDIDTTMASATTVTMKLKTQSMSNFIAIK